MGHLARLVPVLVLLITACQDRAAPRTWVGILVSGEGRMERVLGLEEGLEAFGLTGVELRICNGRGSPARLGECARRFEAQGAAVLVTTGGIETTEARANTQSVPILYVGLAASQDWPFIQSLTRPGGRISGVDNGYAELAGKRLEWAVKALPGVRRVLVLLQPGVVPTARAFQNLARAAEVLGVRLSRFPVERPSDLDRLPQILTETRPDAALILPSYILENALTERVLPALDTAQIPLIGLSEEQTRLGASLSYGASGRALGRQAARMLREVMRGYPIAALPVQRPDVPRLSLNPSVLKRLGIVPSPNILPIAQEP